MASKLGFLLTLFFIVEVIAFSGDIYSVQAIHSALDSASISIAKKISLEGGVTQEVVRLATKHNAILEPVTTGAVRAGDVYIFNLMREYTPLVMSDSTINIVVTRSTVIGYLN